MLQRLLLTALGIVLSMLSAERIASAQLMGVQPWTPSSGTLTFAAQAQMANRTRESAGQAFITQYVTTLTSIGSQNNENTTTIGNLDQITQMLSGGSTATLTTTQGNSGTQQARASAGMSVGDMHGTQQTKVAPVTVQQFAPSPQTTP